MNIALTRTKAETALTEQFERIADALPGDARVLDARKSAIGTFASLGLPHRRIEEWKYTDLRQGIKEAGTASVTAGDASDAMLSAALGSLSGVDAYRLVFVDAQFNADLSRVPEAGVRFETLATALSSGEFDVASAGLRAGPSATGVVTLNTALMTDGAVLDIAPGTVLDKPLMIVQLKSNPSSTWTSLRSQIRVGKDAQVTILEAAVAGPDAAIGQRNHLTDIRVGDRAGVTHVVAGMQDGDTVLVNVVSTIGEASNYRPFFFTAGPTLVRNQLAVEFTGEDAKFDCSGAFLGRGSAHIDNTLIIDHAVPSGESRELFKGVLDDQARGVFQGKVIVRQIAQKTDGKQMAQALMLSEDAEFDSKPELEIYADDVACGHGSTCTEVEPDHVFYLRARGIPESAARALLVEAFIADAIEKIDHADLADALGDVARQWLRQKAASTAETL
ncbi:MAG: Fe-S cluster assembly protein SufD [Pseudomonadota bacterium]